MSPTSKSNQPGPGDAGRRRGPFRAWVERSSAKLRSLARGGARMRSLALVVALFVVGLGIGLWARYASTPAFQGPAATPEERTGTGLEEAGLVLPGPESVATGPDGGADVAGGVGATLPGNAVWPADGIVVATAGWRRNLESGDWTYLPGIELAVPSGAPVRAAADGVVESVESDPQGHFTVTLRHAEGWSTTYSGLSATPVRTAQQLKAGSLVGIGPKLPEALPALAGARGVPAVGSTEAASPVRAVVSFSIHRGAESVDPLDVMPTAWYRVAPPDEVGPDGIPVSAYSEPAVPAMEQEPSPVGP